MDPTPEVLDENEHSVNLSKLRDQLKSWGKENLRSFPWRKTKNPYRLLMAEFMLIRTQATQVEPVYRDFINRYPSPEHLASASREEISEILQPLGLSWRADRVYETGQQLKEKFDLSVPKEKDDLLDLPGVSHYIAGAVRCFAFDKEEPLIDTNTVRISGRLFGLEIKPSSRRNNRFQRLIREMVDPSEPRLYNLSLLDLGAKLCTSRNPDCNSCPILNLCQYGQSKINE